MAGYPGPRRILHVREPVNEEEQIVAIVRESEVDGVTVGQVAKRHGITQTTLFRWRKKYGGLEVS